MSNIIACAGGLIFIAIGVYQIVTQRASFDWTIGNGEPRTDEPPTQVRGWLAVVIGICAVTAGAGIIAKFVL
ncbi:MAG: hypothetical protein ACREP7_03630 [Lysobacter sp.]